MYLDYAATMPMRPEAVEAWVAASGAVNPAGQYAAGRQARSILDEARESVAELMGAEPIEVIFTASGTEADNIAVRGLFAASPHRRVVLSAVEHPAVKDTVAALDADVVTLPVGSDGRIRDFAEAVAAPAAVVTCMFANNETGTIQPVEELIAAAGDNPVHVDAVQAVGRVPIDFHALGATTLASSAHKFGGPRGAGFLLARRDAHLVSPLTGGGQERGLRPGTVNVAGAAGLAAALRAAVSELNAEGQRIRALRDRLVAGVCETIPHTLVHTVEPALPGHAMFSFPGAEGDSLIMLLDSQGIAAATGSACSSGVNRASSVLLAMGVAEADARGALRLTLGKDTTAEDIDTLLRVLPDVVERSRKAGMA